MASEAVPTRDRGIWATVRDLFMADEDCHAYGEGLRRGGFLRSVMTARDGARVVEILDREGAVDMDARQADWELEGWDPARASADLASLGGPVIPVAAVSVPDAVRHAVEPAAAVGPTFAAGEARPGPGGRVRRDAEADGLRLRAYVESHDRPDAMR